METLPEQSVSGDTTTENKPTLLSRRDALGLMAGGALASFLAACGIRSGDTSQKDLTSTRTEEAPINATDAAEVDMAEAFFERHGIVDFLPIYAAFRNIQMHLGQVDTYNSFGELVGDIAWLGNAAIDINADPDAEQILGEVDYLKVEWGSRTSERAAIARQKTNSDHTFRVTFTPEEIAEMNIDTQLASSDLNSYTTRFSELMMRLARVYPVLRLAVPQDIVAIGEPFGFTATSKLFLGFNFDEVDIAMIIHETLHCSDMNLPSILPYITAKEITNYYTTHMGLTLIGVQEWLKLRRPDDIMTWKFGGPLLRLDDERQTELITTYDQLESIYRNTGNPVDTEIRALLESEDPKEKTKAAHLIFHLFAATYVDYHKKTSSGESEIQMPYVLERLGALRLIDPIVYTIHHFLLGPMQREGGGLLRYPRDRRNYTLQDLSDVLYKARLRAFSDLGETLALEEHYRLLTSDS